LPVPGPPTSSRFSRRLDELAPGQVQDQRLVEARGRREVERLERLDRREPRRLEPPLGRSPLALDQLQLAELQEEAQVVHVLGGAAPGHLLALRRHRRQPQGLQVVLQQHRAPGLGLLHGATPAVRLA